MDSLVLIGICIALGTLLVIAIVYAVMVKRQARVQLAILPEKEKAIKWLSDSKAQFEKLFEEGPVPYLILNEKSEIKNINKAGLRFFGVIPEEVLTKNIFSLAAEDDSENAGYLMTMASRNVPIDHKEMRIVARKGDVRWVQLSIFGIAEPDTQNITSLATIYDITEQKNLDRAKTEFVSLASHQLRTPLATVKWYSEMLANPAVGELNTKQSDYVKTLGTVTNEMIELVNTLLNVSRMEIGKLTVEKTQMNVQEIVESIMTELTSFLQKKNMNIVKNYNDLFTNVTGDPKLLRIAIHNLITNAIKYTPEGGTVTITFTSTGGRNQILVADNGYGIPKDQQGKIFSKLFRADNVKEISSSQSSGLGLYLVKSMVVAMGGTIEFESELNKGTTFTVTF